MNLDSFLKSEKPFLSENYNIVMKTCLNQTSVEEGLEIYVDFQKIPSE